MRDIPRASAIAPFDILALVTANSNAITIRHYFHLLLLISNHGFIITAPFLFCQHFCLLRNFFVDYMEQLCYYNLRLKTGACCT